MVLDTVTCPPCLAPALPSKVRGCPREEKRQVLLQMDTIVKEAKTRPCQLDHWITGSLLVAFSFGVRSSGGKGTV